MLYSTASAELSGPLVVIFLAGSSDPEEGVLFPSVPCRGLLDHLHDVTCGLGGAV